MSGKRVTDTTLAHGEAPGVDATPQEKAAYVLARYSCQNDHYAGHYETWAKAILFLLGRHWLKWNAKSRRYSADTNIPAWRQQPVTQIVYAVYRSAIAKLTKQKPALEIVPPSGDSQDRESAHLGEAVLAHLWRLCKVPGQIKRGLGWFLCTGQAYLRVHWDPEAGKLVPLTQLVEVPHTDPLRAANGETVDTPCPCDEHGELRMTDDGAGGQTYDLGAKPHLVPEGEIALGIESPMSVRYNPEAETPDDATEMFVARLWPAARAAKHFGMKEEDLLASGSDEDRAQYDDLLSSAAGAQPDLLGSFNGTGQEGAIGPRVLVIEYYRDSDAEHPKGRHWISIGTNVVFPNLADEDDAKKYPDGEAPLPNGFWPPLIPVQDVPVPGQPLAAGLIPQIVPLNEALNALDGKILEHHVTMAMGGKWIVHPEDRGVAITSDPAQVIASKGYAEGKPPVQARLEALPPSVYAERDVLMQKVSLVSAFNQASLGQKPEGVSSGRGFLVLQEATDSVFTPALEAWEHALEEVGRRMLVLAQQHYTESRSIAIRGERGQWEVRSFMGTDLSDGLDVRVQVGSSFPWSKAAQWDTKLDVLKTFPGLIEGPDGRLDGAKMARYLDAGAAGLGAFESDEDPDQVEVQREHAMFEAIDPEKGELQIPQLGFWQAHAKHLAAHYEFMKRDRARFDRWKPEAQDAFLEHLKATVAAVDAIAAQMAGPAGPADAVGASGDGMAPPAGPMAPAAPTPQSGQAQLTEADFAAANP